MYLTIEFNDQPNLVAIKTYDKWSYWVLASELVAAQFAVPQNLPHYFLCMRLSLPQLFGSLLDLRGGFVFSKPFHHLDYTLTPGPSPAAAGEGKVCLVINCPIWG